MTPEQFIKLFPNLCHVTEPENWPGIKRHGLLSVAGLLDLFEVGRKQRVGLEQQRIREEVVLSHPDHGRAVLSRRWYTHLASFERAGRTLLEPGTTVAQWFRLLHGLVFFWPNRELVEIRLKRRRLKDRKVGVLVLDTAKLVARCGERIVLSSKVTSLSPLRRLRYGPRMFVALADWPWDVGRHGNLRYPVAEVAVPGGVPDIAKLVVDVIRPPG